MNDLFFKNNNKSENKPQVLYKLQQLLSERLTMTTTNANSTNADNNKANVDAWRQRRLVERLEKAKGNGTSMITLLIPADTQQTRLNKLITTELGTASCIKSRVNRNSVVNALKSIQHRVKLIRKIPPNGLAIFCGTVSDDGKERKELTVLEPIAPLTRFVYLCDSSFHVEQLREQLSESDKYGFIVADGHGYLFATVQGNNVKIEARSCVSLPKKHNKGGQSAVRFERLRF